jgi:NTP pyrophosphatase (non-canonical NTP hydrolase)
MPMLDKIFAINEGLNHRFPGSSQPFEIMTRLLEECGELAEQVNHFEGRGVKREKHGEPDKAKMAKEVQDVIRNVLQIAHYYGIECELEASIEKSYQALISEGYLSVDPRFDRD